MIITSRRSNTPSLNNSIHHSLLHSPSLKFTTRITRTGQIFKYPITKPSKVSKSIQSKTKGTQSPIQPNAHHRPKVSNWA